MARKEPSYVGICECCGKTYTARRFNARHCSELCRHRKRRQDPAVRAREREDERLRVRNRARRRGGLSVWLAKPVEMRRSLMLRSEALRKSKMLLNADYRARRLAWRKLNRKKNGRRDGPRDRTKYNEYKKHLRRTSNYDWNRKVITYRIKKRLALSVLPEDESRRLLEMSLLVWEARRLLRSGDGR